MKITIELDQDSKPKLEALRLLRQSLKEYRQNLRKAEQDAFNAKDSIERTEQKIRVLESDLAAIVLKAADPPEVVEAKS